MRENLYYDNRTPYEDSHAAHCLTLTALNLPPTITNQFSQFKSLKNGLRKEDDDGPGSLRIHRLVLTLFPSNLSYLRYSVLTD